MSGDLLTIDEIEALHYDALLHISDALTPGQRNGLKGEIRASKMAFDNLKRRLMAVRSELARLDDLLRSVGD